MLFVSTDFDGINVIIENPGFLCSSLHLIPGSIPAIGVDEAFQSEGYFIPVNVDAKHLGAFPVFLFFRPVDVENQTKCCF